MAMSDSPTTLDRYAYKSDTYGNPIYASVWFSKASSAAKPIALIYHGGGLIVGSDMMVPKSQIEYLVNQGFLVVVPNYRLAPQVTGKTSFQDCEEAYDWAVAKLPALMMRDSGPELDSSRVVAMGHSSGGAIAMHLASCRPMKAVAAFYPSLFVSDPSTSSHQPTTAPPFGLFPDFVPTAEDWASIKPEGQELSEASLAAPGSVPAPRNKWQMSILKNGEWLAHVMPDGDHAAIDPMTRLSGQWPPTLIVQGEMDNVPGSSLELARRAEREMKEAGVKDVRLVLVEGEGHMFDLPPTVGTSDLGAKWKAVVKGLDWLVEHV